MKVVIMGEGTVGYALAERLAREDHDIVVIDTNPNVLSNAQESLDVMTVEGNGASVEVLNEAGVGTSDLLIATAYADELNLLSCLTAKKLGCQHTIARVRNPDYIQQTFFLKDELGLSLAINPEQAAAQEIYRLIQFPSFLKRDAFNKGRVELVELEISEKSRLSGKKIMEIAPILGIRALICAVERDNEVVIPNGSFELKEDDKITVTAARKDLAALIKNLDLDDQKIKSVLIIGAGAISEYLTEELLRSGVAVKVIERDLRRCELFAQRFPSALVIHGDASRRGFLESEGISRADAVITLTGVDEENLIISMFASSVGVPKVITKVKRNEYANLFENREIGSVVCPKELTLNEITRYVRGVANSGEGSVQTLHRIVGGKAEALEFMASSEGEYLGQPIHNLRIKKNMLIACIVRKGKVIIPGGNDMIMPKDTVIIVTTAHRAVYDLKDIFEKNAVNDK